MYLLSNLSVGGKAAGILKLFLSGAFTLTSIIAGKQDIYNLCDQKTKLKGAGNKLRWLLLKVQYKFGDSLH